MKMRAPATPLIAIDPYFSVWAYDEINNGYPDHWTGRRNAMCGTVNVDGKNYRFLGWSHDEKLTQTSMDMDALSTVVKFEGAGIELTATFTSPLLIRELYYASRPVSYIKLEYKSIDGAEHKVSAKISCSEELVLNKQGESRAVSYPATVEGCTAIKIGNGIQKVLWRDGDDLRIDWGYLYVAAKGEGKADFEVYDDLYAVYTEVPMTDGTALFALGYDDIDSIMYFGTPAKAYWKKDGKTIEQAISEAVGEYDELKAKCDAFSKEMYDDAASKGGEKYAELLHLAYRQVMAAHKLVVDENGENIYISKECYSNGCAATVDVTYPSAPLYLYYNSELLKAMLRPIIRFARSDDWEFDFAPHDVGRYPVVDSQRYYPHELDGQMPVEECGNMIILADAICRADGNTDFVKDFIDLLEGWNDYLIKYGQDPEYQLCTDDFAGRLAHNCNLTLKAIMGMAGFADILSRVGRADDAAALMEKAKEYAVSFCERSKNTEAAGYRLAFDKDGTFSLKYNSVWDKLWGTNLFPKEFYKGELKRYYEEALPYGVPLDSRKTYTKSDWLIWAACLSDDKKDFEHFSSLLWNAFNTMHTRVQMGDWYYADIANYVDYPVGDVRIGFRNRTVQGGLFIRLMQ